MARRRIRGAKKAYRKRGRTRTKKRVYRKSRNFIKTTHLPFGQSQKVRHRYLENLQLSTTLGAPNVYTFQVNSLYDPNLTGSGHQPLGRDQMAAIFQTYCVIGAKVRFKCWNRDADEFMGIGLYLSETSTSPLGTLSVQGLIEQGAMTYRILPPGGIGPNPTVHYLSMNISPKKFLKVSNLLDNGNEACANRGANPSRGCFVHVILWQPDGGATSAQASFYLELDQVAIWYSPDNLGQS